MFWMVSSTLSSAVGRFLNFEMGRENADGLNETFSLSLNIMIILALVAAILAESLGGWFITNKMTIPPERMDAARLIFHLSVVTMITGFVSIPFNAAIIAHERMSFTAIVNILETVLKLCVAILLTVSVRSMDKLVVYAILLAGVTVLVNLSSYLFGRFHFQECRFRLILRAKRLGEMFRFAFWNFIASVSGSFSGQGVNMVLNVYHGPVLNTARGLTTTVINAVNLLVYNFTLSTTPQITQSYAAGNIQRCKNLVFRGTRFAAFLILLVVIPMILESHFILWIWLGNFPDHTVSFLRLSLVNIFVYIFIYLFSVAIMATGKIWKYQLIISTLSLLEFVFAWLLLRAGFVPEWIYIAPIFLAIIKIIVSVISVNNALHFSLTSVLSSVFLPVAVVLALSFPLPCFLHICFPQGWLRFLLVVGVSFVCTGLSAFFIGCDKEERRILKGYAGDFLSKLSSNRAG